MASPQVRANAVRQLTSTARALVSQAKTLVEQSEAAPAGSPEKTSLEEQARESLAKARSIAESANKLAQ